MPCLSEIKIGNETTSIDPMLLFWRLVLITTQSDGKIEVFLKYELTTFPTDLFDDSCISRGKQRKKK